jgi:hypothetical protein
VGGAHPGLDGAERMLHRSPAAWSRDPGVGRSGLPGTDRGDQSLCAGDAGLHQPPLPAGWLDRRDHQGHEPREVAGAGQGRALDRRGETR